MSLREIHAEYVELVKEIAADCVRNMSENERMSLRMNPVTSDYHFFYGMGIRNKYIHAQNTYSDRLGDIVGRFLKTLFNRYKDDVPDHIPSVPFDPDETSSDILDEILIILSSGN